MREAIYLPIAHQSRIMRKKDLLTNCISSHSIFLIRFNLKKQFSSSERREEKKLRRKHQSQTISVKTFQGQFGRPFCSNIFLGARIAYVSWKKMGVLCDIYGDLFHILHRNLFVEIGPLCSQEEADKRKNPSDVILFLSLPNLIFHPVS